MQEDSKTIEQIEKYLHEEMTSQESGAFEKRLKADKNLASETDLMRDLIKGIRRKGESDIEKTIFDVRTKLKNEGFFDKKEATVRPMKTRQNWLAYAAAIVVLMAATMFFLDWKQQQNIQMAMDSIEVEKLPEMNNILDGLESFGLADDDQERKNSLLAIRELSKESSIEETKKAFEKHIEYYPRDEVAKLLYGMELLNKNLPNEAINQLNLLSNNTDFQYQNFAKLNLAKAHLAIAKNDNVKAAKSVLHSLSLSKTPEYSKLAKQILAEL